MNSRTLWPNAENVEVGWLNDHLSSDLMQGLDSKVVQRNAQIHLSIRRVKEELRRAQQTHFVEAYRRAKRRRKIFIENSKETRIKPFTFTQQISQDTSFHFKV